MVNNQHYPQAEDLNLEHFFQEHRRVLERFIASRVGATGDVDDLASDVFCTFIEYRRRNPDRRVIHPRALMYKIARDRIADHFIQRSKVREIPIEEAPQLPTHSSLIVDVDAKRDLDTTLDALRDIHDTYREVIILHANVGLTVREIAEMMEKPPTHVRVLLFRARRALKRALKQRGAFDETDSRDS